MALAEPSPDEVWSPMPFGFIGFFHPGTPFVPWKSSSRWSPMPFGFIGFFHSHYFLKPMSEGLSLQCLSASSGFSTKKHMTNYKRHQEVSNAFRLHRVFPLIRNYGGDGFGQNVSNAFRLHRVFPHHGEETNYMVVPIRLQCLSASSGFSTPVK